MQPNSTKAGPDDFGGRFREIVSDPLNLLIRRHPRAGFLEGDHVVLHNGLKVPLAGPFAYYGDFSTILVINRGVHEPLEEYVFQELLQRLPAAPVMLELGAYWGHYSLWLKKVRPAAAVHLVEPDANNLKAGLHNFQQNGFTGEFVNAWVTKSQFGVDRYLASQKLEHLDVLHSDIQGFELEMLADARRALSEHRVDFVFISTHSQELHQEVERQLAGHGYRVEVSSDFEHGTTSYDGFVFASSPKQEPVLPGLAPLGRADILRAVPEQLLAYVARLAARNEGR